MSDEIEETVETEVKPEVEVEESFTSAEDWPTDDETQSLTLPSGAHVKVGPPAVAWLALTGRVPAHLVAIQKHHIADGKTWSPDELDKALDWLICESCISPKVTLGRKAGCRAIATISARDKETVVLALKLHQFIGVLG